MPAMNPEKIKQAVATTPTWAGLHPQDRILQHLGYNAFVHSSANHAKAVADAGGDATKAAAAGNAEDAGRAQDRGTCGFLLTQAYFDFSLDTDADITAAIVWADIPDAIPRMNNVNRHAQNLADTHYPEDKLNWQGANSTDMEKQGTTHGKLADYFTSCYK